MTRRHYTAMGTRFVHEVHPRRLSESRNAGRWPTVWDRIQSLRTEAHDAGLMPMRWGVLIILAVLIVAILGIVAWS